MKRFLLFIFVALYITHYPISANSENDKFRSLVFVFDTTNSMKEELRQVQDGAKKILKTLSENKKKIIQNYIFVRFNDPESCNWIDTTKIAEFEDLINKVELYSYNNTECPEMSFHGIEKALQLCSEHSFVYVFTDAAAKDKHLLFKILHMLQKKKTQVIFVLTPGNCGDDKVNRPYPEYKAVAEASGGQIFDLSQNVDVTAVLEFIRLSLSSESKKVSLLSIDSNSNKESHNYNNFYSVPVDEGLKEITAALSGESISISFTDPLGQQIEHSSKLHNLLDLEKIPTALSSESISFRFTNPLGQQIYDSSKLRHLLDLEKIKVVSIQAPTPGIWTINVGESKQYTLRVTGQSDFNFNFGFSLERINSMNDTNERPLTGSENNIFIAPNNSEYLSTLESCEMIAINGTVMQKIPLIKLQSIHDLYYGTFEPMKSNFHVQITGVTKKGTRVQRISKIAISPAETTEKPIIEGEIDVSSACSYEGSVIFNVALVFYVYWLYVS